MFTVNGTNDKTQLPQTNLSDALPQAHRAIHKGGH